MSKSIVSSLAGHQWPNSHPSDQTDIALLQTALQSLDWSHGELCRRFEAEFSTWVGSRYALLVPSGTAAIYLALRASGLQSGQQVIIPGITWPSVVYAIIKAGGIPITVDICPDTLCMQPEAVVNAITPDTFGILATHLFGSQCALPTLSDIANRHKIHLVEDCAQSIGSRQNGRRCGTWGRAGAFSFNDKKVLACGEGGAVVTDCSETYDELCKLQLILPDREVCPKNLPGTYKVSEFQAAVALGQLARIDKKIALMEKNAKLLSNVISSGSDGQIEVQKLASNTDIQSYYNFCFHINSEIDKNDFANRISSLLNIRVTHPYRPISEISDFAVLGSSLTAAQLAALNWTHPECQRSYKLRSVRIPHNILLSDSETTILVGETILELLGEY